MPHSAKHGNNTNPPLSPQTLIYLWHECIALQYRVDTYVVCRCICLCNTTPINIAFQILFPYLPSQIACHPPFSCHIGRTIILLSVLYLLLSKRHSHFQHPTLRVCSGSLADLKPFSSSIKKTSKTAKQQTKRQNQVVGTISSL